MDDFETLKYFEIFAYFIKQYVTFIKALVKYLARYCLTLQNSVTGATKGLTHFDDFIKGLSRP